MVRSNFVFWAVIACVTYSFVPPLVRIATREVPSTVAALLSNSVLILVILVVAFQSGESVTSHLWSTHSLYLYVAGLFLGIGILSYYRALELGPVSIVVPIFAMFIVGGSVIGFIFLEESVTARKTLGIGLGLVAIYLISS